MNDNFVKMDIPLGDDLTPAINKAHALAQQGTPVEFRFNDITVRVSEETNLDCLWRDYFTADLLGWSTIGPDPQEEYSDALKREIELATAQQELQYAESNLRNAEKRVALARNVLAALGD